MDMTLDLLITDEGNYHKHKPSNLSVRTKKVDRFLKRKNNFLKEMSADSAANSTNSIIRKNPEIYQMKRYINEKLSRMNNHSVKRDFKTKVTLF